MIIEKQVSCPYCRSIKVVKNGKKANGTQNILYKGCGKQFQYEYLYWGADKYNRDKVIKLLLRGSGVRDCAIVLGISTPTVLNTLAKEADKLCVKPKYQHYHKVQIDEQWSYVGLKKRKYG